MGALGGAGMGAGAEVDDALYAALLHSFVHPEDVPADSSSGTP